MYACESCEINIFLCINHLVISVADGSKVWCLRNGFKILFSVASGEFSVYFWR